MTTSTLNRRTKRKGISKKQAEVARKIETLFRIAAARGERAQGERTRILEVRNEDCVKGLRSLETNSVTSCITDPPYGVNIAAWDGKVPDHKMWREVHRVLKPGAFCVAAAAPRTAHLTACELEKAGFEIVDTIIWHYTVSFPGAYGIQGEWRSNLKTNHEPWVVARKPLEKGLTLEENFLIWGTGGVRTGASGVKGWRTNHYSVPKPSDEERDLGAWYKRTPVPLPPPEKSGARSCSDKHANTHPTVKPLALMRTLVKLFTPGTGLVIDPFSGSGTTGMAAAAEGHSFIGFELDPGYAALADSRVVFSALHHYALPRAVF